MSTDKFCLKWNEFESNIGSAFRELRDDKDFFDLTLACQDEQVQAHKVILAACSPFFRRVLKRNRHEHPLLYLKGVKHTTICSLLNFMYHGQVNIAQEELDSFLAVAEELEVKGLTQEGRAEEGVMKVKEERVTTKQRNILNENITIQTSTSNKQKSCISTPKLKPPHESFKGADYDDDIQEIQELTPVKVERYAVAAPTGVKDSPSTSELALVQNYHLDAETCNGALDVTYDEYNIEEEPGDGTTFDAAMISNSLVEGELDLKAVLEKFTKKIMNRDGNNLWQCKSCQKIYKRKSHLMEHVESCHVTGLQFKCPYCTVYYKTRSSVRHHVTDKHREDHMVYKMDMANLEWVLAQ